MKKFLLYTSLLAVALTASAQQKENNDTIISVTNAKNIVITESKSGLKVAINGTDTDSTYTSTYEEKYADGTVIKSRQIFSSPWNRKTTGRTEMKFGGLMLGFVNAPGMPHDIDIEMSKSYEIGILNLIGVEFKDKSLQNSLSVGFGLNWKNYRTTKDTRFAPRYNEGLKIVDYPEGCKAKFSRIKIFSVTLPVIYKHTFTKNKHGNSKFAVSAGAILNYNTHGSMASSWLNDEGNEVKESTNYISHKKFTVDVIGMINITTNLGIYAKYCPMTTLKDNAGLDFRTFSTGIILAY